MPTIQVQIAQANDDAHYRGEPVQYDLAKVFGSAGSVDATYYKFGGGYRFQSVSVPSGAIIDSATITFTAKETQSGTTVNSYLSGEPADDPAVFPALQADFETRYATQTTAKVAWDGISAWTLDTEYTTPDIKTIILELVDRAGWNSGQSMAIWWDDKDDRSTDGAYRRAYSYDADSTNAA